MSNLPAIRPQSLSEVMEYAKMISKSEMMPKDYRNKPENIVVAIQWGYEVGLNPIQALRNISIINGRPSIWGDAAIALVRASGLLEYCNESVENGVAKCTVKRKGEPEQTRTFSELEAKRAGLLNKQGPWSQYPQRMLQMRARGFALRDVFADVLNGIITAEEAQDTPLDTQERVHIEAEPAPVAIAAAETVEEAEVVEVKAIEAPKKPDPNAPASDRFKGQIDKLAQFCDMEPEAIDLLLINRGYSWQTLTKGQAQEVYQFLRQTAREIEQDRNLKLSAEFEASRSGGAA